MLAITCPVGAQIADIIVDDCPFNVGQVQKLILQRKYASAGVLNSLTYANAALLANWTALLTATGNTKVQVTPFLKAPVTEPGEPLTFGSGNEVLNGIPEIVGFDFTQFTGVFRSQQSKTILSLKSYFGEVLGAWFITEQDKIICVADDPTTPANVYPVPIYQYVVGDRKLGGFAEPDENIIQFALAPDWSNKLIAVTPSDFSALTGLAGS